MNVPMATLMQYIDISNDRECANCARAMFAEALRLARRKMEQEKITITGKKLEEIALQMVSPNVKCAECLLKTTNQEIRRVERKTLEKEGKTDG